MSLVIIVGLGSDIGSELSLRFLSDGWDVIGTTRDGLPIANEKLKKVKNITCDLSSKKSIQECIYQLLRISKNWDLIIFCSGTMNPIAKFWDSNSNEWENSFLVNVFGPLRILKALYPNRNDKSSPSVCFFSGAGTNSAAPCYSAYSASKIALIKMCELLDSESKDTSFFIIGPGIVRTKIHMETLAAAEASGENFNKVKKFLASGEQGVSFDDIYLCISWCKNLKKEVIGGRNISLVNDDWRDGGEQLASYLEKDANFYKLRRFGNDSKLDKK
jgi:NAD(P)-dependent dehydrogenase (short-subunit alcohol dehydrogenase family)